MSFSRRGIISTLFRISFHCKEFKLFNYLMTGPKKCEDWARPGVSSNTLFIREQSRAAAKHIAAPAITPTHPGVNCIFISGLSEFWVLGPESNAKCSIYHIFCLLRVSPGPLAYQFIIDHSLPASCCCSLCAVLTLKYHSLQDSLCERNKWKSLASNSRARLRRRERYLIIASNRGVNIKFHVLAPRSINYVNL